MADVIEVIEIEDEPSLYDQLYEGAMSGSIDHQALLLADVILTNASEQMGIPMNEVVDSEAGYRYMRDAESLFISDIETDEVLVSVSNQGEVERSLADSDPKHQQVFSQLYYSNFGEPTMVDVVVEQVSEVVEPVEHKVQAGKADPAKRKAQEGYADAIRDATQDAFFKGAEQLQSLTTPVPVTLLEKNGYRITLSNVGVDGEGSFGRPSLLIDKLNKEGEFKNIASCEKGDVYAASMTKKDVAAVKSLMAEVSADLEVNPLNSRSLEVIEPTLENLFAAADRIGESSELPSAAIDDLFAELKAGKMLEIPKGDHQLQILDNGSIPGTFEVLIVKDGEVLDHERLGMNLESFAQACESYGVSESIKSGEIKVVDQVIVEAEVESQAIESEVPASTHLTQSQLNLSSTAEYFSLLTPEEKAVEFFEAKLDSEGKDQIVGKLVTATRDEDGGISITQNDTGEFLAGRDADGKICGKIPETMSFERAFNKLVVQPTLAPLVEVVKAEEGLSPEQEANRDDLVAKYEAPVKPAREVAPKAVEAEGKEVAAPQKKVTLVMQPSGHAMVFGSAAKYVAKAVGREEAPASSSGVPYMTIYDKKIAEMTAKLEKAGYIVDVKPLSTREVAAPVKATPNPALAEVIANTPQAKMAIAICNKKLEAEGVDRAETPNCVFSKSEDGKLYITDKRLGAIGENGQPEGMVVASFDPSNGELTDRIAEANEQLVAMDEKPHEWSKAFAKVAQAEMAAVAPAKTMARPLAKSGKGGDER